MPECLMEIVTYNKCACANCGAVIDYHATQTGQIIECSKCKEKSRLPEPIKLMVVGIQGPPVPEFRDCEACGTQMQFWGNYCEICEAARLRRRRMVQGIIAVAALIILTVTGIALNRFANRPEPVAPTPPPKPIDLTIHAATNIPTGDGSHMLIAQPRPRLPKSTNDFHPSTFVLEKRRGSDLVMAVGDIENISDNIHSGLRADLDLLDKTGAKIGTVSDYFTELGPHQSWHFLATVTDPNAFSARLAYIAERN